MQAEEDNGQWKYQHQNWFYYWNRTMVFTTGDARPDQEWNDTADEPSWQRWTTMAAGHSAQNGKSLLVSTVCMTADARSDEERGWMKNEGHISTKGEYSVF